VAGGLFVALLIVLTVSVVWVSNDSKHPVVQQNPSPPTSFTPMPTTTVAAVPTPPPVTATQPPPAAPTTEAMSPSQLTAETMAPAPPRRPRLHELFPHLFPNG